MVIQNQNYKYHTTSEACALASALPDDRAPLASETETSSANAWDYQRVWDMLCYFKIPRDGVLLVHSAFKSFARDGYDAAHVLSAFCDYLLPGTLLMPTMSWRFVNRGRPIFDALVTPSNTGILTELFRKTSGVIRSVHPTHSVAGRGRFAAEILSSHHRSETPCDPFSPFGQLLKWDAHVVMFGVGMDCCTLVHHVEEYMAPTLYVKSQPDDFNYVCYGADGKAQTIQLRRHQFLPRNYWQFQDALAYQNKLQVMMLDNSICLHYLAKDMVRCVEQILRRNPDAIIAKPGERYRMM